MDEEKKPTVILHQENHNCNIFQGNIFGGVFPLPGSTVNYCQGGERNENLQSSASEDSLSREDRICHCVEQLIDEDVIRKKGDLAAVRQVLLDKEYYDDIQTTKFVQLLKKGCSPKVHDRPPPLIYHSRSSPFPTAGRESLFRSEAAGMKKQRLMKDSCQISFPKHKTKPKFPYLCRPNCVNKKQLHTK